MKKEAEFYYLEVINETEQLMIFTVDFNKKKYGADLILNIALPILVQDEKIRKTVAKAKKMKRQDAKEAE